jgi:hypothetical protein
MLKLALMGRKPWGDDLPQIALKGRRVKLSIQALKARHIKAQGASPGNSMGSNQPCKGGTAAVPPLQGWFHNRPNPGFHPGLCCCALSALGFIFSSLEAYSQRSRRKKYAALAVPAAKAGETPALRPSMPETAELHEGKSEF